MYVVTFYSYKGGVGRTMTLANVAAELAKRGKKVLIVDFDLEAPGITTYDYFKEAATTPGIVDYVTEYSRTFRVPDVSNFLKECPLPGQDNISLWIMPAGKQDANYKSKFRALNWDLLYGEHSGYLMIENLKEQWHDSINPDYVLIDSRTGHTDIGGICTRQLPDAVALTFFPNHQNLLGIQQVAEEIRREKEGPRKKDIRLHFVASNTPSVDDEHGILRRNLDEFRNTLGYRECTIIQYYDSLALLNQSIFTLERPKTRLAHEYVALAETIIKENSEDRDGALMYLKNFQEKSRRGAGRSDELATLEKRLTEIRIHHPKDGEVLTKLGEIAFLLGRSAEAITLYEEALKGDRVTTDALRSLAALYRQSSRKLDAISVLKLLLDRPDVTDVDVHYAIQGLLELDEGSIPSILKSIGVRKQDSASLYIIQEFLRTKASSAPYAMELLHEMLTRPNVGTSHAQANERLVLTEIAIGRFSDAMSHLGVRDIILHSDSIQKVFNFAMAEWGLKGTPPQDLFNRVVELDKKLSQSHDPNYCQCLAIAAFTTGDVSGARNWLVEARKGMESRKYRPPIFSCWSYLNRNTSEFMQDLDTILNAVDRNVVVPDFVSTGQHVLH